MNVTSSNNLSWAKFEVNNPNKQFAFENMCRSLFFREFVLESEVLHSDPNHPGIEVAPVRSKHGDFNISFQAKYFDSNISYAQIKESLKKMLKVYVGCIDKVYLFCNKDVTSTSSSYRDIVEMLDVSGVAIILITGQTILDKVMNYSTIFTTYFGQHSFTKEWFRENLELSLENLGNRYNARFNISTEVEDNLLLFLRGSNAEQLINARKHQVIEYLKKIANNYNCSNKKDIRIFIQIIESIPDVKIFNLNESLNWFNIFEDKSKDIIKRLCSSEKKLLSKLENKELNSNDEENLYDKLTEVRKLLKISEQLKYSEDVQSLINSNVLIVSGEMGTGKSQLLANTAKKIVDNDNLAILSLGQTYLNDESIEKQFLKSLKGDISNIFFEDILRYMDEYAYLNNCYPVILIDAVNESNNRDIWRYGINSLISIINKYTRIRLVISLRTGFEKLTLSEKVLNDISEGAIASITHRGLDHENIDGVFDFLANYKIPVSPEIYLKQEIFNPLYLTWFCQTYKGKSQDLLALIKEVLNKADNEASKAANFTEPIGLIKKFLNEYIENKQKKNIISKEDLLALNCWQLYGVTNKIPYIKSLERSGIITSFIFDEKEIYYISYNLLEDYIYASWIIDSKDDAELKEYVLHNLFEINHELQIKNGGNASLFSMIAALYSIKNSAECISIIDDIVEGGYKRDIIEEYFKTFCWREYNDSLESFIASLDKYKVSTNIVWQIFIDNSTKVNNELNALGLNRLLNKYSLIRRDYLWTIFVNDLYELDMIIKYAYYIEKGNTLEAVSEERVKLLLILFSWFLTSSNRVLRDRISKAMIEILKHRFVLCKYLLNLFKAVNDPYIIQRLYGIVFGAVMKRGGEDEADFEELAIYIYKEVFCKDEVYPDILLRDYARLIIERFIYEFPHKESNFENNIFEPPYTSQPIPRGNVIDYYKSEYYSGGRGCICSSMMFNSKVKSGGMYGDFGRYVFQAALSYFKDVDEDNIYYYAMDYIFNILGYSEKLFGKYDKCKGGYGDRTFMQRTERIGKKYQWITFYNVLARLSDTHKLLGPYSDDKKDIQYNGPWNLYVRDFDPTLNTRYSMNNIAYPVFDEDSLNNSSFLPNNALVEKIDSWLETPDNIFNKFSDSLIKKASDGTEWFSLRFYKNCQFRIHDDDVLFIKGDQDIWMSSTMYLVSKSNEPVTLDKIESSEFMSTITSSIRSCYSLFNREYSWSPGYVDEFCSHENFLKGTDLNIIPACINFLWEEEFDASKESAISFYIPAGEIIQSMGLYQRDIDGIYYYKDEIVAFNQSINDGGTIELLLRRDILDKFLGENNYSAFWYIQAEKIFFLDNRQSKWSNWNGYYLYKNNKIDGKLKCAIKSE